MKNIHVLSTKKSSRLHKIWNEWGLTRTEKFNPLAKQQQIYITSEEEIKEGDWVKLFSKHIDKELIHKITKEDLLLYSDFNNEGSKIILTTDQDLIKDGVQAIDDEFLEWFVKNPNCEFVEIELEPLFPMYKTFEEDINVPPFYGNLRRKIVIPKEEAKQETLEEAVKKYFKNKGSNISFFDAVFFGAKWQQEQDKKMYSEEEVFIILEKFRNLPLIQFQEWFEQFKNK